MAVSVSVQEQIRRLDAQGVPARQIARDLGVIALRERFLAHYVAALQRLEDLPRLLRLLAARSAAELNVAGLANDAGIPVRTLAPDLSLLETLYLIQRIPAWLTNLSRRVVSRPKCALLDTGLAARLVNVDARGLGAAAVQMAGGLLEGFVAGELRRQLAVRECLPDKPVNG